MKINVISENLGTEIAALIQAYQQIDTAQIDKLISELVKLRSAITNEPKNKDTPPILLTAQEAADYLGVSRQTIYNRVAAGSLKSRGIGGDHRFTHDDLNGFHLTLDYPKALCVTNSICYDKKTDTIGVFRKDSHYDIVDQGENLVSLFNEEWDGAMQMDKKFFKKYFSVEGELEYDANKYGDL